jgi:hypothetical protein
LKQYDVGRHLDLARDVEQSAVDAGEIQPAATRDAGRRA